jgi:nicotinamidase/pyrazinamidase
VVVRTALLILYVAGNRNKVLIVSFQTNMIQINPDQDALIIVDVQNDFCPGGTLAVSDGDKIIPIINSLVPHFKKIFTTQDWHPKNHISFKSRGGIWPIHCIAGTKGADFHPDLEYSNAIHIKKGSDPDKEAYSGFQGTRLNEKLNESNIKRLFITGLATDYCIKNTVLDARQRGFDVIVVVDAVMGVNVSPVDSDRALTEMSMAGAKMAQHDNLT